MNFVWAETESELVYKQIHFSRANIAITINIYFVEKLFEMAPVDSHCFPSNTFQLSGRINAVKKIQQSNTCIEDTLKEKGKFTVIVKFSICWNPI